MSPLDPIGATDRHGARVAREPGGTEREGAKGCVDGRAVAWMAGMRALRDWSVRHAGSLACVYRTVAALAPRFAPLARWFGRERLGAALLPLERATKSAFFDCRMCGQCALVGDRHGLPDELRQADAQRPLRRRARRRRLRGEAAACAAPGSTPPKATKRIAPRPYARLDAARAGDRPPAARPVDLDARYRAHGPAPTEACQSRAARQPRPARSTAALSSRPAAPATSSSRSRSRRPIRPIRRRCWRVPRRFNGLVDAINITDGAGGNCHMSSVAASSMLAAAGYTPVYQVACRDRNRIAVQGDMLGAAALGVRNVLCLTGDDVSQGDHPQAKPVFDLDAVIAAAHRARHARPRRIRLGPQARRRRRDCSSAPPPTPSCRRTPTASPTSRRRSIAGAQFIQTQFCFDLERARGLHATRCAARGLHQRAAHPRRRRHAGPAPRRCAGWPSTCPACTCREALLGAHRRAPPTRRPKASASASRPSTRCAASKASPACT